MAKAALACPDRPDFDSPAYALRAVARRFAAAFTVAAAREPEALHPNLLNTLHAVADHQVRRNPNRRATEPWLVRGLPATTAVQCLFEAGLLRRAGSERVALTAKGRTALRAADERA